MSRRDDRIDADRAVRSAAKALGIRAASGLADAIIAAAETRVARWIEELGDEPRDLDDVHRLVLNQCGVRIERINTDEDIARIEGRYRRAVLPVQLDFEFSQDTEALVFRNPAADGRSSSKFVAVVDARGERAARVWFAERHEPGHLLCKDPSTGPYRRTPSQRAAPIEQVVDGVAAAIGFWRPIVEPVLAEELKRQGIFDAFDATRKQLAPQASVEASYRAFVRLCDFPLLLLRSSYATRKHDRTGLSRALRATTVIHNTGASKAGLHIPHNFRIPENSIIHAAHSHRSLGPLSGADDLGRWQDSKGTSLASCRVGVLARGAWAAFMPM